MSIYKNYLDLKVISSKLAKKVEQNPNKVSDIYRRSISIGINSLHQIAKKKSAGGYAISILESECVREDMEPARIQTTIRIYTKKNTSLEETNHAKSNQRQTATMETELSTQSGVCIFIGQAIERESIYCRSLSYSEGLW